MSATTDRPTAASGAPLDAAELAAWRGFLRTHARLVRELDAQLMAAHDMPLSSYEVLLFLAEAPGGSMRMSELAGSVLLSRSGLTRLVDRLERDRLVRRVPCDSDARGLNAVITPAGRRRFSAARKTHLAGVRELFLEPLGEAGRSALAQTWERLEGATSAPAAQDEALAPPAIAGGSKSRP